MQGLQMFTMWIKRLKKGNPELGDEHPHDPDRSVFWRRLQKRLLSDPLWWPSLNEEFAPYHSYCKGIVLNAASGKRVLQLSNRVIKLDINPDTCPDIVADLHALPLTTARVDTVVSIATLEHCRRPWRVVEEFYRVLKPGGILVVCVPFLQPVHDAPFDFYRFTSYGLEALLEDQGFDIELLKTVHHIGNTIGWIAYTAIQQKAPIWRWRWLMFPLLWFMSRGYCGIKQLGGFVSANGYYVVAKKKVVGSQIFEPSAAHNLASV